MKNVIDVAKYVVHFCTKAGRPIKNLQLQKILYYIQINFYCNFKRAAFIAEFQAWDYGPVVPEVYDAYHSYSATKICNLYDEIEGLFKEEEKQIVDDVIKVCVMMEPQELVERSHIPGGPWDRVYEEGRHNRIPEKYIEEHAQKLIKMNS